MSKKFIGFWNVSVILTYIELCIAVGCICLAADGYLWQPAVGLVLCGICDMFDGKIARATKRCEDAKVFGIQIDSLCDLVSFGVLPSAMGHAYGIGGWGTIALMLFTLAAVIRLGYFNVMEQKRQETTTENRKSFEGLPVTYAAVIFPLLSLLRIWVDAGVFAWIYGVVLMVTAFFNLARIRIPKPQI